MRNDLTRGLPRLAAVAVALSLSSVPIARAAAQTVAGQAYGTYVQTPTGSQSQTPLAVLPSVAPGDGDMADARGDAVSVPGVISTDLLTSVTSGSVGADKSGVQSVATVAEVSVLGGLITAARVIGVATSARTASGASSDALGSSLENLQVNGVSLADDVAPNTRVSLPGVGYVVLNEQLQDTSGITVNMIHVVLQNVFGSTVGEIVVGSAMSRVS